MKNIILNEDTVLVKTNFISKASDVDVQASKVQIQKAENTINNLINSGKAIPFDVSRDKGLALKGIRNKNLIKYISIIGADGGFALIKYLESHLNYTIFKLGKLNILSVYVNNAFSTCYAICTSKDESKLILKKINLISKK